jgi:hypothetical protein
MAIGKNEALLSFEQAHAALAYDPATGSLVWRWRSDISDHRNRLFVGREVGRIEGRGYRQVTLAGKNYQAHRLAWFLTHGQWPVDEIDHINGVRSDNRIVNLRLASRQRNTWNTVRRRGGISGFKGVVWNRKNSKWEASIRVGAKRIYLGLHETPELAHAAYLAGALRYRGVETVRYDASSGSSRTCSPPRDPA